MKNNNIKVSENKKEIHYENVKEFFRKSAAEKTGFYNLRSDKKVERELKKRYMWKIYISVLNEILQTNKKISNVADVACGMGNFTMELSKHDQIREIIGIDFLKETFNIARKADGKFSNITFFQGDLLNLPFKNRIFDLTVCLNTLHHIYSYDFSNAISELSRVTNRNLMVEIRNKSYFLHPWKTKIVLPKLYSDLPIYTNSIKELNKLMDKNRFKLKIINGNSVFSSTSWRLVAVYERT